MAFVLHARDSALTSPVYEPLFGRVYHIDGKPPNDSLMLLAGNLYVIDRWNHTPLYKLLSSLLLPIGGRPWRLSCTRATAR